MDRASLQHTDVTEGLESTLAMLGHKLRDGVTVVRDYADLPRIDAYAGELNQVWTNLIDNAVDAMDGRGTLRVTARVEEDMIVVEIGDTGPGMAPDVAARAFEAFYTTKDVGKGTGSASTSPAASSRSGTRARSASTRDPARRSCGSASRSGGLADSEMEQPSNRRTTSAALTSSTSSA